MLNKSINSLYDAGQPYRMSIIKAFNVHCLPIEDSGLFELNMLSME
jgi:hypothetical protein